MPKKIKTTAIKTHEELEETMGEYARHAIVRGQLVLAMEERINMIRKDYEGRLADCDALLETLFADMEAWAALNPGVFASKKSIDLVHGTLGYRTGMPALKPIKGCKWEHILDMLKCRGMHDYVRTIYEVDKAKLLADRESIGPERLQALGVRVDQAERFFVEPRQETT